MKYEEVYLKAYANGLEARNGLREYFRFYNHRRPHQALGYRTPAEVFHGEPVEEELKERRCPGPTDLVSYGGVQESHLIVGLILSNRWGPPQFSCCAVTLGCSGSVRFFVFLYGLPLLSGFPADASRRRFRIWSAQGWLDSGRLCRAPRSLAFCLAHLSCLSLGFPTFWTLPPKAFVLSSALGISLF